jgi:hypothetical protein
VGAVAFLARRRRQLGSRGPVLAAILAGGSAATGAFISGDASASVSIAVPFDDLVRDSTGAAVVIPVEQRSTWEAGRIWTYTHVRIETRLAGALPAELWIRTRGGEVGDLGQIVDGEAVFAAGAPSLVFLRPRVDATGQTAASSFVVAERAQGQFAIVRDADGQERLAGASSVGALVPPSSRRMAALAVLHRPGDPPRLAREVLHGRLLGEAARDIAAAWQPLHTSGN